MIGQFYYLFFPFVFVAFLIELFQKKANPFISIAFTILGINYSILLSLLTAVLDLLPVLGVSAVYVPMAIYYY